MVGLQLGRIESGFCGEKIVGAGGTAHSGRVATATVRVWVRARTRGIRIWSDGGWKGEEG